jgi:hypothetical protein
VKDLSLALSTPLQEFLLLDDGLHNVSRWMTWLPISLKNAAKCDKWYQLQNHPITESLNAKGAREKLSQVNPVHAVSLSVEQTSNRRRSLPSNGARILRPQESWLCLVSLSRVQARQVVVRTNLLWLFVSNGQQQLNTQTTNQQENIAPPTSPWRRATIFPTFIALFTDLSAAGPPAELKHITQRRKRKQP